MAEIKLISDKWEPNTGNHILQYEVIPGDGETVGEVKCSFGKVNGQLVTVTIPATKDPTSFSITASVTKDEKTSTFRTEFDVAGDTAAPDPTEPRLPSWSAVSVNYDKTINDAVNNDVTKLISVI